MTAVHSGFIYNFRVAFNKAHPRTNFIYFKAVTLKQAAYAGCSWERFYPCIQNPVIWEMLLLPKQEPRVNPSASTAVLRKRACSAAVTFSSPCSRCCDLQVSLVSLAKLKQIQQESMFQAQIPKGILLNFCSYLYLNTFSKILNSSEIGLLSVLTE